MINIPFQNLDLLTIGVAISAIAVLGFVIYLEKRKSVTNQTFLAFSLITVFWAAANYFHYQVPSINMAFWLIKIVIFLGVWHAFTFFQLFYVFPKEKAYFPKKYKFILVPLVAITSVINLTQLVFKEVAEVSADGRIERITNGPGIALFGTLILFLIAGGIFLLIKKTITASGEASVQFRYVLGGAMLTFVLIITFNFLLPAFFNNPTFIPLSGVFIFPFVAFTSWAILKHKLFNVRVAGTAVLVFLLSVVTFFEVILATDIALVIYRSSIFILVLSFGVLLIRGVMREVEQREKLAELNKKLQAAYEEVDRLSKAKSEFISIASHQLRTPLSAIKGYISMLVEGTYGKLAERAKRPLDNVYQSNERLLNLVNNLLDISRIEAGRMEFEPEPTSVEEIIDSVIGELKITAEQKKLELNFEKPKVALPRIMLDREKIRQVFLNLVNNAIKYTKEGGITIKQLITDNKLLITVKDTGEGMTKEDLAKIFETFSRGTVGTQLSAEGAGLGLYIAKKFVEMHQGRVWAESEGKSKGSTFYVELPIK